MSIARWSYLNQVVWADAETTAQDRTITIKQTYTPETAGSIYTASAQYTHLLALQYMEAVATLGTEQSYLP